MDQYTEFYLGHARPEPLARARAVIRDSRPVLPVKGYPYESFIPRKDAFPGSLGWSFVDWDHEILLVSNSVPPHSKLSWVAAGFGSEERPALALLYLLLLCGRTGRPAFMDTVIVEQLADGVALSSPQVTHHLRNFSLSVLSVIVSEVYVDASVEEVASAVGLEEAVVLELQTVFNQGPDASALVTPRLLVWQSAENGRVVEAVSG